LVVFGSGRPTACRTVWFGGHRELLDKDPATDVRRRETGLETTKADARREATIGRKNKFCCDTAPQFAVGGHRMPGAQ
jgi:hypothetical protein